MSQIRKAHSVEIIDKRLRDCELSASLDLMELIGLHDELSRVERKWLEKSAGPKRTGSRARPMADAAAMNNRFEKLTRLIAVALRKPDGLPQERQMLSAIAEQLNKRTPLPTQP